MWVVIPFPYSETIRKYFEDIARPHLPVKSDKPYCEFFVLLIQIAIQWIQDFLEGSAPTYYLPNFSWKLHEKKKFWPRGGARPWHPLRSATGNDESHKNSATHIECGTLLYKELCWKVNLLTHWGAVPGVGVVVTAAAYRGAGLFTGFIRQVHSGPGVPRPACTAVPAIVLLVEMGITLTEPTLSSLRARIRVARVICCSTRIKVSATVNDTKNIREVSKNQLYSPICTDYQNIQFKQPFYF